MEADTLTNVRNSEASKNFLILNKTFPFEQHKRHFINKLLDLGHYVEIIVNVNNPDGTPRKSNLDLLDPQYNVINETILNEINKLFDTIVSLEIEDFEDEADLNDTNKTNRVLKKFKYANDLCAIRLKKCSIENGLFRVESFQQKLLEHKVDYLIRDPKSSYGDTDTVDGFSFNVMFGKYRKEILVDNNTRSSFGDRYVVVHSGSIRIRFDLLSTNQREKYLSLKFMNKFAEHLSSLQENNTFKNLNFSFHTSHSINSEIEKYSKIDSYYVVGTFFLIWTLITWSMWLNFSSSEQQSKRLPGLVSNEALKPKSKLFSLCVNGAGFLPFCLMVQFTLNITSAFGLISLLNIEANPLTLGVLLILLSKCLF